MEQQMQHEQQRLQEVQEAIAKERFLLDGDATRLKDEVVRIRRHFWDEVRVNTDSFDDYLETIIGLRQEAQELAVNQTLHGQAAKRLRVLDRMQGRPYFGRIDFRESGSDQTAVVYIGIGTLRDDSGEDFLVYDWRAPISSVYYDYQPGEAHYQTPGGKVDGTLEKKWQYVIKNGELESVFDTGLTIGDEVLQQVLGHGPNEQMGSIVATIQQEQNQVVRHDGGKVLVVHGAAGSGKTSVAMQRIAYLLYHYRDTLTSDQILLFSPNALFAHYVANVLPELGEENMRQVTFQQYVNEHLHPELTSETPFEQLEYVYTQQQAGGYRARLQGIEWKATTSFMKRITAYLNELKAQGMVFRPIRFRGDVLITAEDIANHFYTEASFRSQSIANRLEWLAEELVKSVKQKLTGEWKADWVQEKMDLLTDEQYHKAHQTLAKRAGFTRSEAADFDMTPKALAQFIVRQQLTAVAKAIRKFAFVDTVALYRQLFEQSTADGPEEWKEICAMTLETLDRGHLFYEDATPYIYIKQHILGIDANRAIRQVVIDEAQDYSAFQFEMIKQLYPNAQLTILGDFNQAIFAHARTTEDFEGVTTLYGPEETRVYYLARSYRSTRQIVEFTRKLVPNGDQIIPFDRSGSEPQLVQVENVKDLHTQITHQVERYQAQGYTTIAIICLSAGESSAAFEAIGEACGAQLITTTSTAAEPGVVIIPSYLAKGMEYEAVIVYNASADVYSDEFHRRTFYTVCTRAMHELTLFSVGEPTHLLANNGI
ncbi:RNA polymerase recycling motor HelD [Chryseomicrobium palamuruense]|uniref:RNA polymerase recycling motor HelD n=1 Tax=Chryseomicrobium palamuruense TaxID=682973 RepID=A0ABV8UYL7_9BACL